MKKILLILLNIALVGCYNVQIDPYLTQEDKAINEILGNYSTWVKKTYQIHPIGTSVGMPNGILNLMGVEFQACRLLSKQEAREIIVNSGQKLLSMINSEPRLQDCLVTRPFKISNICMKIFVKNAIGIDVYDPDLSIIRLNNGYLEYVTRNESRDYVSETDESYAEALKSSNLRSVCKK